MKILLTLAAIAFLVIAAILYFGSGDLDLTTPARKPVAAATPPPDFHAVAALLAKEMGSVPVTLDAPSVEPADAFGVKSRLVAAPNPRPEYQTLAHACELIIYADQEHSIRRRSDQVEQQTAAAPSRLALHAKAQADWNNYRLQTDAEVKRLLASLPNAKP